MLEQREEKVLETVGGLCSTRRFDCDGATATTTGSYGEQHHPADGGVVNFDVTIQRPTQETISIAPFTTSEHSTFPSLCRNAIIGVSLAEATSSAGMSSVLPGPLTYGSGGGFSNGTALPMMANQQLFPNGGYRSSQNGVADHGDNSRNAAVATAAYQQQHWATMCSQASPMKHFKGTNINDATTGPHHGMPSTFPRFMDYSRLAPSSTFSSTPATTQDAAAAADSPASTLPVNPNDIDVIFGRGEPTRKHPGNVFLRDHVARWLGEYMESSKSAKSAIIRRVIQEIEGSGARYLVPLDPSCRQTIFSAGCREATKAEVRSKVSHAFRDGERRALLLQQKNEKSNKGGLESTTTATSGITPALPKTDSSTPSVLVAAAAAAAATKHHGKPIQVQDGIQPPTFANTPTTATKTKTTAPVPDLLSFANILTSLKKTSSPEAARQHSIPFPSSPGRLQALSQHQPAATIRSALVDPETVATKTLFATKPKPNKRGRTPTNPGYPSLLPPPPQQQQQQQRLDTGAVSTIAETLEKYCRKIDIVFGRGAPLRQHPGNIRFRQMVSQYNEQYGAAPKHEKTAIIQRVIREILDSGAKFLIMNDDASMAGGGAVITDASADDVRMKVSHRFRDFAKDSTSSTRHREKCSKQPIANQENQRTTSRLLLSMVERPGSSIKPPDTNSMIEVYEL